MIKSAAEIALMARAGALLAAWPQRAQWPPTLKLVARSEPSRVWTQQIQLTIADLVDEAHGSKLASAWEQQQQLRFEQIMQGVQAGRDQLCFVEVESAYWLRQRCCETVEITLVTPELG